MNRRFQVILRKTVAELLRQCCTLLESSLFKSSWGTCIGSRPRIIYLCRHPTLLINSHIILSESLSMAEQLVSDSFQLYDLHVEVVCPPGERIMCGAKVGDYFTLEGEMLYLPQGQGMSIYSLGEISLLFTS